MKKNFLYVWIAGCMALILSSCLGSNETSVDEWVQGNSQIASFTLKNDSVSGLSSVKFTIDQLKGEIFNIDSMPYGTVINRKLVCSLTYDGLNPSAIEVYQEATGNQAYWNGSDSLDFSKPVKFNIYSYDGKQVKTYTAKLNIHQQIPDAMAWNNTESLLGKKVQEQQVIAWNGGYLMFVKENGANALYQSDDAVSWSATLLNGLPNTAMLAQMVVYETAIYVPSSEGVLYQSSNGSDWSVMSQAPKIKALLGVVKSGTVASRPSAMATVVNISDSLRFASMNNSGEWAIGQSLPDNFPIEGFGRANYESVYYQRLLVVAGKMRSGSLTNASWETMDGLSWLCMTDGKGDFEAREGVALADYDDKIYMIGGINASNTASKDIYVSSNRGMTWALADTLVILPTAFSARGYVSALVDDSNFMLLFGGKERRDSDVFDELWKGRINRLGFKE